MYSYVLSKINLKKAAIDLDKDITPRSIVEKLIDLPEPFTVQQRGILEDGSGITLSIEEPVSISFKYLNESVETILRTEVSIGISKNPGLMISSPRGIGILKRGNARKYIDSFIGPMLTIALFGDSRYYRPVTHDKKNMNPLKWGEDLRKIKVDIPEIGTMVLTGPELDNTVKNYPDFESYILKGKVDSFKVFSTIINRTVEIFETGTLKTSDNNIKNISDYLARIRQ